MYAPTMDSVPLYYRGPWYVCILFTCSKHAHGGKIIKYVVLAIGINAFGKHKVKCCTTIFLHPRTARRSLEIVVLSFYNYENLPFQNLIMLDRKFAIIV
jgi:hypothetical protein